MVTLFLISFIVMLIAVSAMAIGVILGRSPIKGSCGGLNTIKGLECGVCIKPCAKRRRALMLAGEE